MGRYPCGIRLRIPFALMNDNKVFQARRVNRAGSKTGACENFLQLDFDCGRVEYQLVKRSTAGERVDHGRAGLRLEAQRIV
jgi:hypothetical protein